VSIALFIGAAPASAGFEDSGAPIGSDGVITPANLGEREVWPLTIKRATFVCKEGGVFLSDGKISYPVNGTAKGLMREDPTGRRPLEDIWLSDTKTAAELQEAGQPVEVVRPDISPILKRGIDFCRGE
jgi:hypothetical protein